MITTITLNAAVDKLYLVEAVKTGTVMRVKEVYNTPGGKGLNVAKVAALAGEPVLALGFAGGYSGQSIRRMLKEKGIAEQFTEVAGETRSCINVRDLSTGEQSEFLEPGAPVSEEEQERFFKQYCAALPESRVVCLSGSVPGGVSEVFYPRLIAAARDAGVPVILDTSGNLLRAGVKAKPDVMKPNADEIAQLLGKPAESLEEIVGAAEQLHAQGIAYVAVSLGEEGSLLVCDEGVFQAVPPKVTVVNTVGSGDSWVAGFAVGLTRGYGAEKRLMYASAIAASNVQSVETGHIEPEDIPALEAQVCIRKWK